MMRYAFITLLLTALVPAAADGQELPRATKDGDEALAEVLSRCIASLREASYLP